MMAEDLDDGEFWLPSHFLLDLQDTPHPRPISTRSDRPPETETDDDDSSPPPPPLLTGLTPPSPKVLLSSSPQSTLYGCVGSSSRGSPSAPISPPPATTTLNHHDSTTWDLLNKAAGQVATLKLTSPHPSPTNGTGFFDCSNKLPFCPPPTKPTSTSTFISHLHPHFPPHSHLQQLRRQQMAKLQFNILTRNNNSNNNRPLGLPPSAWPPLKPQSHPVRPIFMGHSGIIRDSSVGTGVFLPRHPPYTHKHPEGNSMKMRSGKQGSQSQIQSQRRRCSQPKTATQNEIQLPQEWTY